MPQNHGVSLVYDDAIAVCRYIAHMLAIEDKRKASPKGGLILHAPRVLEMLTGLIEVCGLRAEPMVVP